MQLKGKRVLITGGSSGIGRALADSFAQRGAVLAIVGRRADRLKQAAREIAKTYTETSPPLTIRSDVTDRIQVREAIARCERELGGIDVLVNNAGISVYGETQRTSIDDFRAVLETNFFGALNYMLEVVPVMEKQGSGVIVNIASVAALHGVPYLAAYSASKAALMAASQSLRAELYKTDVTIMMAYPGYTETDIFKREKNVGGAHRPPRPYTPPAKVAEAIVEAVEGDKRDLVFTLEGKTLYLVKGFIPGTTEKVMMKLAEQFKDKGGDDEQT